MRKIRRRSQGSISLLRTALGLILAGGFLPHAAFGWSEGIQPIRPHSTLKTRTFAGPTGVVVAKQQGSRSGEGLVKETAKLTPLGNGLYEVISVKKWQDWGQVAKGIVDLNSGRFVLQQQGTDRQPVWGQLDVKVGATDPKTAAVQMLNQKTSPTAFGLVGSWKEGRARSKAMSSPEYRGLFERLASTTDLASGDVNSIRHGMSSAERTKLLGELNKPGPK
jgi:hypothetical protein